MALARDSLYFTPSPLWKTALLMICCPYETSTVSFSLIPLCRRPPQLAPVGPLLLVIRCHNETVPLFIPCEKLPLQYRKLVSYHVVDDSSVLSLSQSVHCSSLVKCCHYSKGNQYPTMLWMIPPSSACPNRSTAQCSSLVKCCHYSIGNWYPTMFWMIPPSSACPNRSTAHP
jgi:hypothetical protein